MDVQKIEDRGDGLSLLSSPQKLPTWQPDELSFQSLLRLSLLEKTNNFN